MPDLATFECETYLQIHYYHWMHCLFTQGSQRRHFTVFITAMNNVGRIYSGLNLNITSASLKFTYLVVQRNVSVFKPECGLVSDCVMRYDCCFASGYNTDGTSDDFN